MSSCVFSAGICNHCQWTKITYELSSCFGDDEQNEAIIGGDDILRTKFLWAKFEQDKIEKENWLMWY